MRELDQTIEKDEQVANEETFDENVLQRARERIQENTARRNELRNERERLEEGSSLRDRRKAILKRYGFTLTAITLVVETAIGVMVSELSKGLNSVADGVGNGLKDLSKKVILPATRSPWLYCELRVPHGGRDVKFLGKNA